MGFSVVIPAKNEASTLGEVVRGIQVQYPQAELIVVNDGSTDNTSAICSELDVIELKHPYSKGNGASIKSGVRRASNDVVLFMDGDGQHKANDIEPLLASLSTGYDMVVGARDKNGQASKKRWAANAFYNWLASVMVGHKVEDLTSGMRVVRKDKFMQFIDLLPNGFSYPTTSTIAFFRAGYSVGYQSIDVKNRYGESHIDIKKDGVRFLLIIFKIITLYSPLKLFFPISGALFSLGLSYYVYTFFTDGRFTNMGALLFTTSVLVFLMGLVSEQITNLMYLNRKPNGQD